MKKTFYYLALSLLMASCTSHPKQVLYEKNVVFPENATVEQK